MALTSVILYFIYFLICSVVGKNEYARYTRKKDSGIKSKKISIISIVVFSLLAVLLNYFCTKYSVGFGGDRINYKFDFDGYRSASIGLDFVFTFIKGIGGTIYTVFYFTTFVCCFITFWAYRNSEDTDYNSLLFLLSTNFVLFTFTGLKQCYTCALAAVLFSIISKPKNRRRDICSILVIILACLFHSTGFILVPVFLFARLYGNGKKYTNFLILVLLLAAIFMPQLGGRLARLTGGIFPTLSFTLQTYLGSEGSFGTSTSLTFLQGIAFYLILILVSITRKRSDENNQNFYYVMTVLGVVFYALSYLSYWMSRFTSIFFLPIAILLSYGLKHTSTNNKLIIRWSVVGLELFFTLRSLYLVYALSGGF